MAEQKIDESLYSRQLYTIGLDAMVNLTNSNVLISCKYSLSGSALEIAKCIVLAGLKNVSIHTNTDCLSYGDLASNYYASEEDVGKEFLDKSIEQISTLNPNVEVKKEKVLTADVVKRYKCVVFCDYTIYDLLYWNRLCRENNVKFISLQTHGLIFSMFCDFGDHVVSDMTGETPNQGIITQVKLNTLVTSDPHKLFTGDVVQIEGIKELSETNYVVKVVTAQTFKLIKFNPNDSSLTRLQRASQYPSQEALIKINPQNKTAHFKQIKVKETIKFKSLLESLDNPDFVMMDTTDWEMPKILHAFMKTLSMWAKSKQFDNRKPIKSRWDSYPNSEDYEMFRNLFNLNYQKELNNNRILQTLLQTCRGVVCGVDAVAGSICAHEIIKAVTGKYKPTKQFLHFEALDILENSYLKNRSNFENNFKPINSRYDGQIVVFGKNYVDLLREQKTFIVGAGAIGCEHVKNFSMMGIKNMVITDMDHIEKSNLNRQFLFRPEDIGKPKSVTAGSKGQLLNPDVKIEAHENKVCTETLNIYDSNFFERIDLIANALDNVEARLFVDSLCVKYKIPLLESGTLGTKGSIQCVIPDLTESYSALQDPPEKDIPLCTLKQFPYRYEHVVQFARDTFEGFFNRIPSNLAKAREFKSGNPDEIKSIYDDVKLLAKNCENFKYCINLGYKQWHYLFRDTVNQLIQQHPADSKDENGNDFWTGNKVFPETFEFSTDNNNDVLFVIAFSHIWADMLGIPQSSRYPVSRVDKFIKFLNERSIPKVFEEEEYSDTMLEKIKTMLEEKKSFLKNVKSVPFEKDDDTNNHIKFITALAQKRAQNYSISSLDELKTKGIVGKIIPAIATTTSLVSGLVALEFYKVVYGKIDNNKFNPYNTLDRYRYGSFNLANQMFGFSESYPPKITNIDGEDFSIWTQKQIDSDTILEDLIEVWTKVPLLTKDHKVAKRFTADLLFDDSGVLLDTCDEDPDLEESLKYVLKKKNPNAKNTHRLTLNLTEDVSDSENEDKIDKGALENFTITLKVNL